jgi:small-conductance mechanosensitive channel
MLYQTDPQFFTFSKPKNWNLLLFYEKIFYYKSTLNKYYAPYVDKLIAKQIVKDLCKGDLKVANVIRILNGPNDLYQTDLNPNHIIKAVHGSGWNINITSSTNLEQSKKLLNQWNRYYTEHNEKQYTYIKPRFFIEEKINDKLHGRNGKADVYTFRCIKGVPISINVKRLDNFNKYDINFNLIENPCFDLEKPNELDEMIEFSKVLSKPFEFVRIDFYLDKDSNIYFSEFTFTPNAGNQFYSLHNETILSSSWI